MSLLDIHVLGSPILRQITTPVETVTDDHRRLIDDMFETMYAAEGIGLAAPQVGRIERIAVIDVREEGTEPFAIVNPEIVEREGSARAEEGCLSMPDLYGDVDRATRIVVRALDRDGAPFEMEARDLLARCLQHEIDHLHGRLFIDYLGLMKRRSVMKKWEKLRNGDRSLVRKITPKEVARHHHRGEEL
ncbi:MAG TPA: peptide deformylase [Gemmatimonadaceae bacterium]|nr:peptide deformylase [Gemmatimonadaceae bacterium]